MVAPFGAALIAFCTVANGAVSVPAALSEPDGETTSAPEGTA